MSHGPEVLAPERQQVVLGRRAASSDATSAQVDTVQSPPAGMLAPLRRVGGWPEPPRRPTVGREGETMAAGPPT